MAGHGPFNPLQKRTRSQIPDLKFNYTLDRSPLKEARALSKVTTNTSSLRNAHTHDETGDDAGSGSRTMVDAEMERGEGSGEGLQAEAVRKKRPSSPSFDQENVKKPRHSSSSRSPPPSHEEHVSPDARDAEEDRLSLAPGDSDTASGPGPSNLSKPKPPVFVRPPMGTPRIDLTKLPPSPYRSPARPPKLQFRPVPSGLWQPNPAGKVRDGLKVAAADAGDSTPRSMPTPALFANMDLDDDTIAGAPMVFVNEATPTTTPQPSSRPPIAKKSMPPPGAPSLANWLKRPGQSSALETPLNQTGSLRAPGLAARIAAVAASNAKSADAASVPSATAVPSNAQWIPETPVSPLTPLPPTPFVKARPTSLLPKSPSAGPSRLPRPPSAPSSPVKKPSIASTSTSTPTSISTSDLKSMPSAIFTSAAPVVKTPATAKADPKKPTRQLTLAQAYSRPKGITKKRSPSPGLTSATTSTVGGATGKTVSRLTRSSSLKQREKATQAIDANKAVAKSRPAWGSPVKPASAISSGPSSPIKFAGRSRSHSTASATPSTGPLQRPSLFGAGGAKAHSESLPRPGSSLDNLALALKKLHAPPPERPNTSMGFHREASAPPPSNSLPRTDMKGKPVSSAASSTAGSSGMQLKRSNTMSNVGLGLGAPSGSGGPRPLSRSASGTAMKGAIDVKGKGKAAIHSNIMRGHNLAWERPRVLQPTTLSTVPASPMKGGETSSSAVTLRGGSRASSPMMEGDTVPDIEMADATPEGVVLGDRLQDTELSLSDGTPGNGPGQLQDVSVQPQPVIDNSLRTSAAFRALSHSISVLPTKTPRPRVAPLPPKPRSTSATYITRSMKAESTAGIAGGAPSTDPGPSSNNAEASGSGATPGQAIGSGPDTTTGAHVSRSQKPKTLKVLSRCSIFVDVRTDHGDDASGLFVDMLKGLGARILTKLGNAATHVVYKNGLQSTLTRYRLIREPRPHVVGIAWVVECVEQMTRVDETCFKVTLDEENIAGGTKHRRRSMIPKQVVSYLPHGLDDEDDEIVEEPSTSDRLGGQSAEDTFLEHSSSSILVDGEPLRREPGLDDDAHLPPLEKARRRLLLGSSA